MQKLIVTGGCGFVGREVVARAVDDFEVHVIDNLRSGPHRLDSMPVDRFELHRIDIRDRDAIRATLESIAADVVLHLAAIHFIPECERNPNLAVGTNVLGTVNLLDAVTPGTRFLNVSSAAVYASGDVALDEATTPVGPLDVYGWTKLHAEQYTAYLAAARGFAALSIRLFNVIGQGETNPHVLPEILAQLKSGSTELRLGNITPRRDFIDVGDVADGMLRLIRTDAAARITDGRPVNLGTGRAFSVAEILDELRTAAGIDFTVTSDPARVRRVDRPVLLASCNRLKAMTGWVPSTPLKATVERLWAEEAPLAATHAQS